MYVVVAPLVRIKIHIYVVHHRTTSNALDLQYVISLLA